MGSARLSASERRGPGGRAGDRTGASSASSERTTAPAASGGRVPWRRPRWRRRRSGRWGPTVRIAAGWPGTVEAPNPRDPPARGPDRSRRRGLARRDPHHRQPAHRGVRRRSPAPRGESKGIGRRRGRACVPNRAQPAASPASSCTVKNEARTGCSGSSMTASRAAPVAWPGRARPCPRSGWAWIARDGEGIGGRCRRRCRARAATPNGWARSRARAGCA